MKITKKAKAFISGAVLVGALFGAAIKYTDKTVGLNNKSPIRQKIELNENYTAELVRYGYANKIFITNSSDRIYIIGEDLNKDTIIDNIYKGFEHTDSTIQNLSSVKELSKIEKELLEKK